MVAILRSDHLPYTVQRDELNKLAFKILSANQPAQQQSPRAISPVRHPAPGYEGDYGDTFVFGDDVAHQRCARAARAVFNKTREAWLGGADGIALYAFAEMAALRHGCTLVHEMTGQRIASSRMRSTAATNWRKPDSHPETVCGYWRSSCVTMSVRSGLSLRTFRCGGSK